MMLYYSAGNELDEAHYIADKISEHIRNGTIPEDIAVLFRNFKTKFGRTYTSLCEALDKRSIPYRVVREMSLLQRAAVKDILAYIDLLLNPDNVSAFLRVYNTPRRRLGEAVERRLLLAQEESLAAGSRRSLMDCSRGLVTSGELGPQRERNLRDFISSIEELRANLVVLRPPEVIDRIVDRTGYTQHLKEERAKMRKKKEAAGEDVGDIPEEDLDNDEGEEGSEDEEEEENEESAIPAEGAPSSGADSISSFNGGTNSESSPIEHWPYAFKCKLSGPLRRLQGEAIKWVKEAEPRLGLESNLLDGIDGALGPPRLESLCYQALSTAQGMQQLVVMLKNGAQNALNSTALEVVTAASACGPGPLAEFQSYLRLGQTDITAQSLSSAEKGVCISTIHAAKGLEWPVVFVPRLNEGFLPAIRVDNNNEDEEEDDDEENDDGPMGDVLDGAMLQINVAAPGGQAQGEARLEISEAEEALAEERRLAHVAVTRAKDKLYLTYIA